MATRFPLRIGILGAARIAPNALILPAQHLPDVQIWAVAARDPAFAQAFAARHHIPRVHANYAALIYDPEIDAIYNPLPNSLHSEWTTLALRNGKHVLCEKPLTANAAEAAQLAQVANETGCVLAEAFHYRYHPLAVGMKGVLDRGELGHVRHLEAHFCVPLLRRNDIRYRYDLAGGALMDLGCYTINQLRYLAGAEPQVVSAKAKTSSPQVDRWMEAEFCFADGRTARTTVSFFSTVLLRIETTVRGDQGEMRVINPILPHRFHRLTVRNAAGKRSEHFPGETSYTYQLRAFAQAVRGEAPMPTDATDAIANMRVIDAVYEKAGLKPRGT
ncbi:MAG: Gfo/Idh/MocA family oxidoreductase [Chloroflexi bacterium]|nr:Gfo/Idh/MocA family oxidoreductase [Chloroflexota bacterium]